MFSTVIQRHPDTREIGSIWVCHSRSMCTNDSRMFTAVMQRDPYIAKTASRNWFCYHVSNCCKAKWIPKENELSTYEYKYPSADSASLSTIADYIAKPTPNFPFFFSFYSAPKESITCTLSQSWPSPASQISLKAAVSILYLANSLLIRTVRLSGLFFLSVFAQYVRTFYAPRMKESERTFFFLSLQSVDGWLHNELSYNLVYSVEKMQFVDLTLNPGTILIQ